MTEPVPARDRQTRRRPVPPLLLLATFLVFGAAADAATLELSGPPGARVLLDGRDLGRLPLDAPLALEAGTYEVRCELTGHAPFAQQVILADEGSWVRLHVRLERYSRLYAVSSNLLLAGLGQHHLDRPTKGWIFGSLELGGLLLALYGELSLQNHEDDYQIALDAYRSAVNAQDIARYRRQVLDFAGKMDDDESLRTTGLLVAAGSIALSMLDAWLNFPGVEAGAGQRPVLGHGGPGAGSPPDIAGPGAAGFHAAWRLRF